MLQKATTSICTSVKKMYIEWIMLPSNFAFLLWIRSNASQSDAQPALQIKVDESLATRTSVHDSCPSETRLIPSS